MASSPRDLDGERASERQVFDGLFYGEWTLWCQAMIFREQKMKDFQATQLVEGMGVARSAPSAGGAVASSQQVMRRRSSGPGSMGVVPRKCDIRWGFKQNEEKVMDREDINACVSCDNWKQ
jgi:hypothetical protein